MNDTTHAAREAERAAKAKALIPPARSEERDFWLEAAVQHGFEETAGGEHVPEYDPPAYFATADEVLALMASARQQGRDDVKRQAVALRAQSRSNLAFYEEHGSDLALLEGQKVAAFEEVLELISALQSRACDAETFARRIHAGQVDKGGAPYTGHLGRVAARARAHAEAMGLPRQHAEWCEQIGWLHDTIEDTGTRADDLLNAGFDPAVVQAVQLLTRPPGKPYLECVAGIIASGDRLAMIVKLSDNEDNLDPARALPTASPAHAERYQRSAEMLRAALAPPPSITSRGRDA